MAKTAREFSQKVAAQHFDFSNTENDEAPRMQIRAFRVVPNQMSATAARSESALANAVDLVSSSREHATTVTLPMPNELKNSSKFDWSVEDRSILQNMIGNFNGDQSLTDIIERPGSMMQNMMMRTVTGSFDAFGTRTAVQNAGFAVNPLKEIFFDGLSVRTKAFSWDLFPRNSQEAQSIMKMARKINIDAHPEKFSQGINIIPAEFEISWINAKLPKFYKCVCTEFEADYAASGEARFFKDGFPSFIRISASFTEIEILDRLTLEEDEW